MKTDIGKNIEVEFPRRFIPSDADFTDLSVIESFFKKLQGQNPSSADELEKWLLDWSELSTLIKKEGDDLYLRMILQTDDPEKEKAYLDFAQNVKPHIKPLEHALAEKFNSSPAVDDLDGDRYKVLIRDIRNAIELFREENVPLETQEELLVQRYMKTMGAMTVDHDGAEKTLDQMKKYLEVSDRSVRKEAWEKIASRRLEEKDILDGIFDEMSELRRKIARNAGFDNYRDYKFKHCRRFDYGVAECEDFHDAVEKTVVPLLRNLQEKRRVDMGLDVLKPWDMNPDPLGRPPLKPFENVDELTRGCAKIFNAIDPELGERFKFMVDHELLDLASRKGKGPGAFCFYLPEARYPFIFANAVGIDFDVTAMLHESGHAFHCFEFRHEPLFAYRGSPMEFAEVASMSMELLGFEYLEEFYPSPADAARAREKRLNTIIGLLCWIATIDAFQHWIYTHPGHNSEERTDAWVQIKKRFGGIEDWSGYEDALKFEWHKQLHIFGYPFYYIEYGIAQLGALQVWKRYKERPKAALADYRKALSLGGAKPLPQLFEAAGIKFDFSSETLEPLMEWIITPEA